MSIRNDLAAFPSRILFRILFLFLALGPGSVSWSGPPARPVAMVTDLQGTVSRDGGGSLTILADLAAGTRLSLAGNGRIQVLMVADGRQFDLVGPGGFTVLADGPRADDGGRVQRGAALSGALRDLRLRPARIAQASITMRGEPLPIALDLRYPVGTRLLTDPAHFSWTPIPAATGYVFQLMDGNGHLIHEAPTPAARIELPAPLRLRPGEFYAWQVRALLNGGGEASAWAEFGIADQELLRRVEEARPPAGADFSQRLLFALFLDQQGLRDEARRIWRDLALERPDERRLRALAAER